MDAIEALKTRRSIRRYEDRPVDRETLEEIVDCGRLAASARNEQPCEFVVVTDVGLRQEIAAVAAHGKFIAEAAACIVVVSREADYFLEDGSAATQNILVAARAKGLGSCWVAGDKKPYAAQILQLVNAPSDCRLISLISVGWPAQTPSPAKRPLEEVLHWEKF
jgi:nitroreductase